MRILLRSFLRRRNAGQCQRLDSSIPCFLAAQSGVDPCHFGDLVSNREHRIQRRHRLLEPLLAERRLESGPALLWRQFGLDRLGRDRDLTVVVHPGPGRDETTHDDVLFQTAQIIYLAAD